MKRLIFFTTLSLLSLTPSHADDSINPERPGFTNGAATVGYRVWQFEEGLTRSQGEFRLGDGGIARYGLSAKTELRLGLPSWQHGEGFSTSTVGFKTQLLPQLAVIAQQGVNHDRAAQAALEAEFPLTPRLALQADLVRDAQWSGGLNLGFALTPKLGAFIESYRAGGWHGDGGLTYQLTPDRQVDISGGDHFVSVGYAWRIH